MIEDMVDTRLSKGYLGETDEDHDVLFDGFGDSSKQEAEDWITQKLNEFGLEEPWELYHKGDAFKGILYAKYASAETVQKVTKAFGRGRQQLEGKPVWCRRDLSVDKRGQKALSEKHGRALAMFHRLRGSGHIDATLYVRTVIKHFHLTTICNLAAGMWRDSQT